MLCSSKKSLFLVLPYLHYCIWLFQLLRLHPLPEPPFIFYLANSSLSFKNQLSCHSFQKPFLPPPQHLFAKAGLNVPLLWSHTALCIASSVIWLYFFLFVFFFASPPSAILVLQPGIRPVPPELKAWSLNHWTAREVSGYISLYLLKGLSPHSARLNSTRAGEHLIHLFFPWAFIYLFYP